MRWNLSTRRLHFAVLFLPLVLPHNVRAAGRTNIAISKAVSELFIDDYLIASQQDVQRTLHQPTKDNGGNKPLIATDTEFGNQPANLQANGTIVYDPRLSKYVMLALGTSFTPSIPIADRVRIYRFTSSDAMHWVKGDNGVPQWIHIDLLDKKSGVSASNTDLFSYFYDDTDSDYPYKGWLYFANWGGDREGTYYVRSKDGLNWQRGPEVMKARSRTIEQNGRTLIGIGDVTTFYHDPLTNRFLALIKFHSRKQVGDGNNLRSRAYLFVNRLDQPIDLSQIHHVDLVPSGADAQGDLVSDEYYASSGWRYQSLWLGELKIWHRHGDYPYSAAGSAFLKLIVSRDGLHWHKVPFTNDAGQPEVFIPNGPEGANHAQNDGGYITLFSQGPLKIGNQLIFYYGSSSYGKNHSPGIRLSGGGIFRARLRPDGFVSVDHGTLTTKPLIFEADDLFINSVGPLRVELLDRKKNILASSVIDGDSLDHRVSFDGKSLRQIIGQQPVQLRFSIADNGHLYSFSCR